MKLIIDIPEEVYEAYCVRGYCIDDAIIVDNAIIKAKPLDDVKAEIEQICQEIDTVLHNEYENAVELGKESAYENVLSILDNIGKEMSE